MNSLEKTLTSFSNSLFSIIITIDTLILIYFPSLFLHIIFSPVLISTIILLLCFLRLFATHNSNQPLAPQIQYFCDHDQNAEQVFNSIREPDPDPSTDSFYTDSFVEWNVRAPLEVIYEEENDDFFEENRQHQMNTIQRYGSLSLCYPESDSNDSSDGDWPTPGELDLLDITCFRWGDDEDDKCLIEIGLHDRKRNSDVDEDNLIEIDISPAR